MTDDGPQDSDAGILDALRGAFTRNLHLKAIALLLTFALYLWVGTDTVTRVVAVPFEISEPADQVLLEPNLDTVKVTLEGRSSALESFQERTDKSVALDLSKAEDGQMLAIPHHAVDVPAGLRVAKIEPSFIRVEMADKQRKEVAIRPRIAGTEKRPYDVGKVTVDPDTVVAQGPRSEIADLDAIPTEPVDVSGRGESFTTEVQLRPTSPMIRYELADPVEVSVTIEVERLQRTFEDIEVRAVNTTDIVRVSPSTIDVSVRGPRPTVEQMDGSELFAVVDLSDADYESPGTFEEPPKLRNLPSETELVRPQPEKVVVTARPRPGSERTETPDAGNDDPDLD